MPVTFADVGDNRLTLSPMPADAWYCIKFLGGADQVHIFVGLAPGNHGTTLDGPALQDVMNALGPDNPAFQPTCTNFGISL